MIKVRIAKITKSIDYTLLGAVALILVMGFFVLDSATVNASARYGINFVLRQILWAIVGLGAFCCVLFIDYSKLSKFAIPIFALNIVLLVATLIFGEETNGAQAWIPIGPFKLQPAEIAKILLIVGLAQFLVPRIGKLNTLKDLLPVFVYVAVPLGLILLQPDLGTGLVYVAIMFGMLLAAGASPLLLSLLFGGGIGAIALAVFGHYTWGWWLPLKTYQLNRLVAFINPMVDPRGAGWNVIQSQIAVGSGGLWGKGLGMGSQNINNFLPAQWTDFIFCVLAEELGFIGAVLLLGLFFVLLFRGLRIAKLAKDPFGTLIAVGVVSMFAFHILQNVGMTVGLMPITGIPLPFVSYGGSSLLANMLALGLLMNVYVYHDDRLMY
ncbi:MAG TPA: rod shape-determining protein RodA [Peptococcaceae bacterium]|nr:rod shape-determining protein RodA [Peptococcaceae bacterium]HPZ70965.1 rod shape-determining protein RodA [Peptococcaceae bacterium]HQD54137.1 rod shape-determining protein RodA [Peptococcaceae bacterium]